MSPSILAESDISTPPQALLDRYRSVRSETEYRAAPLSAEDQQVQSMPDCSPTKWHCAHTTWFFETFILVDHAGYKPFDPRYAYLFNSYYEAVGARQPRPERGLLSRPSIEDIVCYRAHVDAAMTALIENGVGARHAALIELGLQHEQQHQELLLTDIKHAFWLNPLRPAYRPSGETQTQQPQARMGWVDIPPGIYEVGAGLDGFAFDNEGPRHRIYLQGARLATRPVTCGEYLAFMQDGGYMRPEFWLSDGWGAIQSGMTAPLYWVAYPDGWQIFTLEGEGALNLSEPVQNLSFYEASAYAAWAGKRLPTEFEWEIGIAHLSQNASYSAGPVHPGAAAEISYGDVWEWTGSAYTPYPGYRPPAGAIGEYNGKFMSGQMVLRGGSWATPQGHARATYRNFFPPSARWQASGLRLAEDQ